MESMLEAQGKLKKGSQQLNQMLDDMEKKQVFIIVIFVWFMIITIQQN